jgi:hypothetical protein
MAKLLEGMERGALEHLVLPLISVDEFESKIDDRRVIVTGFYVKDQSPATDLSNFVEKSNIRPLDTEVSPAPTDDGFYMVFVEMGRNDDFPKRLVSLAEQLSNLTTTKKWKFKPYLSGNDEFFDLTEDNIREYINLDPTKVEIEDIAIDAPVVSPDMEPVVSPEDEIEIYEHIGSFLKNSLIESVEIKGEWLRISERGNHRVYQIADWRKGASPMPVFGLTIGNTALRESNILQSMLGPAYHVECGDGHVIITDGKHNLTLAVDSQP